MNTNHQHRKTNLRRPIVLGFLLLGSLSFVMQAQLIDAARATAKPLQNLAQKAQNPKEQIALRRNGENTLPRSVSNAVRRHLSNQTRIPRGQLSVVDATRQTWSDTCLGLGTLTESCGAMEVEGWRVVVTDGQRNWIYRADAEGENVRLEAQESPVANLPTAIANTILQQASELTQLPVSELSVISAERTEWSDGCLGLPEEGEVCTQAIVPGWWVRVRQNNTQQVWFYRTNDTGSVVRLDILVRPNPNALLPVQIPTDQLPPPLGRREIFRAIASGGIAGRNYETILFEDGRLVQAELNSTGDPMQQPTVRRISAQQLNQFKQLLESNNFAQFNRLSYPAPNGAADYFTYMLSSARATTSYTDINQDELPESLQTTIQAWNQIANPR